MIYIHMYRYYYFNAFETNATFFHIMLPLIYMSLNIAFSDFSLVLYSN